MPIPKQYQHFFSSQAAADTFLEFERLALMIGKPRTTLFEAIYTGFVNDHAALLRTRTVSEAELIEKLAEAGTPIKKATLRRQRLDGKMDRADEEPQLFFTDGDRIVYALEECLKFFAAAPAQNNKPEEKE